MYVIKNALRNIIRAKGRSILIFILILVIAISSCVALSIKSSAENAKENAFSDMTVTAQIGIDRNSMMQNNKDPESMKSMMELMNQFLSKEELTKYAASKNVSDFYISSNISLNSPEDGIEKYSTGNNNSFMNKGSMGGMDKFRNSGDFSIIGYDSHDGMKDFINGSLSIKDGQAFDTDTSDNSCVISEEVALLNELSIGDTFTLVNPQKEDETIDFTIKGIFTCESSDSYANDVYVSYNSIENICNNSEEIKDTITDKMTGEETTTALVNRVSGTYVFSDPDKLEAFKDDVKEMGLDTSLYAVTSTDVSEYEKSIVPLDNLSNFTMVFFIVVLIIGAIILIVFNLFTIRERKYEIGVLAAIGMHKFKVALQFLTEVIIISILAVVIGAGIGSAISQPIGESLLQNQVQSVKEESSNINSNFGGNFGGKDKTQMRPNMSTSKNVNYIDTLNTSTDFEVIAQLMGIALLLSISASSIGIISIIRYEPLKILSERA